MNQKITISINAAWGSEHQKNCAYLALKAMIAAWQTFSEARHKKNAIICEITDNDD